MPIRPAPFLFSAWPILLATLAGCPAEPPPRSAPAGSGVPGPGAPGGADLVKTVGERAGLVLEHDAYGDSASRVVYLDQNWNPAETLWYYFADQGSVLMPYAMLVHLEQADNARPFIEPAHMSRFRFLTQHKTPNNPHGLPVGFARHKDKVGLTCAACHTSQINYRGAAMRIDGAPGLLNLEAFLAAVERALAATLADPDKLARYASAVPGGGKDSLATARTSLSETLAWFKSYNGAHKTSVPGGFGRLDAIGRIFNQVIRFTSNPDNSVDANAPANYPLMWDAPRHDYVQWTAFAPNAGAGSLGRNAGEVLGVFGSVDVVHFKTEAESKKGYRSTIEADALVAMEEALRKLSSPVWPETILPAIDQEQAAHGKTLYQQHCVSCHLPIDRGDPKRHVVAQVYGVDIVGTDATAANNLVSAVAPSGKLQGALHFNGEGTYGAEEKVLVLLGDLVSRSLSAQPAAAIKSMANAKLHGHEEDAAKQGKYPQATEQDPTAHLRAYKARPLNGIWASAPYLHNGSVPTLHDLLLPPKQRPQRFSLGRWEYDPKKVGYVSDGDIPFVVDTTLAGNGNGGHLYGTTLSDSDRWALVEYLKTL